MTAIIRVASLGGIAAVAFTVGMLISAAQYDMTAFADMLTMLSVCLTAVAAIHHTASGAGWPAILAYGMLLGTYGAWFTPSVTEAVSLSLFNIAIISTVYAIYRSRT